MRSAAIGLLLLGAVANAASGEEDPPAAGRPGLLVKDGLAGTGEGHAIGELQYWISWGDYDLAEAAYRFSYRDLSSANLKFVRSWALLRLAVARKKGFDRALAAMDDIDPPDKTFREHVAALVMSVRAAMPCVRCDGQGRLRCVACHGLGDDCDRCEEGEQKCPGCEGPRSAPSLDDICRAAACGPCEGRGLLPGKLRLPCEECRGVGQKLVPKADPQKKLP
jgi:hypothetical protein